MTNSVSWTIADYSDERSTVSVPVGDITALTIAGLLTQIGTLKSAIEGLTSGVIQRESWGQSTKISNALPASQSAQRESKILVIYEDSVTYELFRMEIPCRNDANIALIANTDKLDLSDAETAAFVTAFEAIARQNGHACNVLEMSVIGRRT